MRHLIVALSLLAALAAPTVALATPAEERVTLAAPIAAPSVSDYRLVGIQWVPGAPLVFIVQGCVAGTCDDLVPTGIAGTETMFRLGEKNSFGPSRTNVSGYAVTVGGKSPECAVTPANFRQYQIDAANANAGNPFGRAIKEVVKQCLGGS